ncbi:MAG: hypothetical protein OIN88_01785 [Candidatus Methanoperedens sp.]|nr:hypothetical protein [Candidatus Methanoperedens sp.]MCZ7360964.1 hypothetical protein [Candidatus Methanoperedens sp.]HLB71092.1 hypothetical protein [Candidatus Methanoperedens sp.]
MDAVDHCTGVDRAPSVASGRISAVSVKLLSSCPEAVSAVVLLK